MAAISISHSQMVNGARSTTLPKGWKVTKWREWGMWLRFCSRYPLVATDFVGTAVRTGEGLCLHLPPTSFPSSPRTVSFLPSVEMTISSYLKIF
jgi:hypothetical protein